MNKTAKIIIAILILVCGFLVVFAQIQANEAQKQNQASLQFAEENEKLKIEVEICNSKAERLAADAIKAQSEAMKLLQECKSSK